MDLTVVAYATLALSLFVSAVKMGGWILNADPRAIINSGRWALVALAALALGVLAWLIASGRWTSAMMLAAFMLPGDNARGLDADTGFFGNFFFPVRSGEAMVEMIYQAQLAPWWMLQPEVQYIIRPGGGVLNSDGSLRPNAWVIAVRSALSF